MAIRTKRNWKEITFGEVPGSLIDTQAEFQSIGLLVKGSQPIYEDKIKIGKNLIYMQRNWMSLCCTDSNPR